MADVAMSRSKSPHRLTPAVVTQVEADRTERQQLRALRVDLQTILDGWDSGTNAQRFGWTKDTIRILRRALRLI